MSRLACLAALALCTGCFLYPTLIDLRIPPGVYFSEKSADWIEVKDDKMRCVLHLTLPLEWKLSNEAFEYVVSEDGRIWPTTMTSALASEGWVGVELTFDGELIVLHERVPHLSPNQPIGSRRVSDTVFARQPGSH